MAWNEPGNGKDPWSRGNKEPNDLDQIVQDWQRRLRSLLGGGGGSRAPGGAGGYILIGLLLIAWGASGVYRVDEAERGVVQRFGAFTETTMPGIHWHLPIPIEAVDIVNTNAVQNFPFRTEILTADEQYVFIQMVVQYRRTDPVKYSFEVVDPEATVQDVTESALREVIGTSALETLVTGERDQIARRTLETLQSTLDQYESGITVTSVSIINLDYPQDVQAAVNDTQKATNDSARFQLEAEKYAKDIIPRARGDAQRITLDAKAYKDRVTRDGSTNKVLLDSQGSGNLLYLPIDKLIEGASRQKSAQELDRLAEQSRETARIGRSRKEDKTVSNAMFRLFVVIGLIAVAVGLSLFTVNERDLAIKLQLGKVVQSGYEPGLHFKIPVVQNIRKFPRRILTIEDSPDRVFTAEKKALKVDFFVKWRIVDPVRFYTSTGGSLLFANDRLGEIIKNAVVTEFGKRSVREAISAERAELMRDMLVTATTTAEDLGVELIDFRVKQVELMDEVKNAVYAQMNEERARTAAELRAEGRAEAERIRAEADRERTIILADANRESEQIRGEGDAEAAEIYADAYKKDPEFYAFYRSINAYKNSMGKSNDLLVLDPNNEFFRYLNQSSGE
jgi:HflK protein